MDIGHRLEEDPGSVGYFGLVLGTVATSLLYNDCLGVPCGTGLFALVADLRAAAALSPAVDLDAKGLMTLFVAANAILLGGAAALLRIDLGHRVMAGAVVGAILIAAIASDFIVGTEWVDHYMLGHGYTRCRSRDHYTETMDAVRQVRIDGYVLAPAICPDGERID